MNDPDQKPPLPAAPATRDAGPGAGPGWRWRGVIAGLGLLSPWWIPNTPWAKQWMARQVLRRTGLECRLGLIIPVGWDGRAHVTSVQLRRPAAPRPLLSGAADRPPPLVDLPLVTAEIRWSALGRGRVEVARLILPHGRVNWSPAPPAPAGSGVAPPVQPAAARASAGPAVLPPASGAAGRDSPSARDAGLLGSGALAGAASPVAPTQADSPAHAPAGEAAAAAAAPMEPTPSPSPPAAIAGPHAAATPATPAPPPPTPKPASRWRVDHLQMPDLHVRWLRSATPQAPEWAAAKIDLEIPLGPAAGPAGEAGRIHVSRLHAGGRRWPSVVDIPVAWDGVELAVRDAAVPVPGGTVRVSGRLLPHTPGLPVAGEASFDAVDLGPLTAWLAPDLPPATGAAAGAARWVLLARYPGQMQSVGQARLTGLVLPVRAWLDRAGLPGVAAIWPEPAWPVRAATVQFHSSGGLVTVEDATLSADELTVRALGTASLAGGPSISLRAYVPPGGADLLSRLSAGWPPERRLSPAILPNSPWAYLDTSVQASWTAPEISLWGRSWTVPELRRELQRLPAAVPPPG